jgi:hypothetical protein
MQQKAGHIVSAQAFASHHVGECTVPFLQQVRALV